MSPEQIDASPLIDGRTDLFSLGVVLYQATTGVRPFWRPTITAILAAVTGHHPPAPRTVRPDCPAALSDLIERLLSKNRDHRPASARQLADDLRALEAALGAIILEPTAILPAPEDPPAGKVERLIVPAHRRRTVLALLAVCATLGTIAASLMLARRPGFWTPVPTPSSAAKPPPKTYTGSVDLILTSQQGRAVRRRLIDPEALPVRSGDQFRIEAGVQPGAYLYLFWITTEGEVLPVFPWKPGKWGSRPPREQPNTELVLPANLGNVYTFEGHQEGMETLVLLARPDPLPLDDDGVRRLFAGVRPQRQLDDGRALVWFDDGKVVEEDSRRTRSHFDETPTNNPVLQMQALLQQRLGPHARYTTAVSFAKKGQ
jgi:hypothetical protein